VDRPNAGAELIRAYGVERFFFGSGFPMWDPGLCLKEFLALDLRPGEQEKILHQNDREILGESS
jgi:predicted TIM-barrel fold metal-dependent hydrolase